MADDLTLKWGSIKYCDVKSEAGAAAFRKYAECGTHNTSAMFHRDTPEQKKLLCELIDAVDCETILLEWEGEEVSKEAAKKYVMEYGD